MKVLLIEGALAGEPFFGKWALPGGFVAPKESLDDAAARELEEETGVTGAFLEQLYTFGVPDRDARRRVITVAYFALVNRSASKVRAGSDAERAEWFDIRELPDLAFDHREILDKAIARLRGKVRYEQSGSICSSRHSCSRTSRAVRGDPRSANGDASDPQPAPVFANLG
jgi:8-oxo-dGTP diphosphatase